MERDVKAVRDEVPTVFTNCKTQEEINEAVEMIKKSVPFYCRLTRNPNPQENVSGSTEFLSIYS